jgi:hypothetical protein
MSGRRTPGAASTARGGYFQHHSGWRSYSSEALRRHLDFARINGMARDRLDEVCRWLFPAGKREGNEFLIGSLHGEPGRSLKVHLAGDRAGLWRDFATGHGGRDPVSLVAAAHGTSQRTAALALARLLAIDPWS